MFCLTSKLIKLTSLAWKLKHLQTNFIVVFYRNCLDHELTRQSLRQIRFSVMQTRSWICDVTMSVDLDQGHKRRTSHERWSHA